MRTPLVSVLMTAYNREDYISEAIESVLSSTLTDFELIICDDTSSDKTVEIAREYAQKDVRIRLFVNEQNLGDYPNRNKAASYAKGKYLKYLDSDDLLYENGLQEMVDSMEKFPEAGFGLCCLPDPEHAFPILLQPRQAYLENYQGLKHFDRAPGSAIIKRSAFEAVGGFSGKRMIGDFELWHTLGRLFPMVKMNGGLYWSRVHENQEKASAYAKQYYHELRFSVEKAALLHEHCPIPKKQAHEFLRNLQVFYGKKRIKKTIRNMFPLFFKNA